MEIKIPDIMIIPKTKIKESILINADSPLNPCNP